MTKTPQTGDTIRVTYDTTLGWLGDNQPGSPGVVLLGQAPDGQNIHVQSGKDRKVVSVEVIKEARPDFLNGDVIQSSRHPHEVAVRAGSMWRWTSEPGLSGWDDAITAGHLDSGVYTPIRIGGKSAAAQS